MKKRNDFCRVLGEIVNKCLIDENEFSDEMITGIWLSYYIIIYKLITINNKENQYIVIKDLVMLCVWPETIQSLHWLSNVKYEFVSENIILKHIMLDIINKVLIKSLKKIEVILSIETK